MTAKQTSHRDALRCASYPITATLTVFDEDGGSGSASAVYQVNKRASTFSGYSAVIQVGNVQFKATLIDGYANSPLANRTVQFTIAGNSATATSDASGNVQGSVPYTPGTDTAIAEAFYAPYADLGRDQCCAVTGHRHWLLTTAARCDMLVGTMAKIGRNDSCPCGSGKKYKHCCYAKEHADSGPQESIQSGPAESRRSRPAESRQSRPPESRRSGPPEFIQSRPAELYAKDPEWLKIRRTEGEMVSRVLEFALSTYGPDYFEQALEEFGLWGEYEVDKTHHETIFIPWFAFNWVPEIGQAQRGIELETEEEMELETEEDSEPEAEEGIEQRIERETERGIEQGIGRETERGIELGTEQDTESQRLGIEYLARNADALDRYQQDFIREACAQPYSFFVVTDVRAGESLGLRDIFLSRTFTVKEAAASQTLRRGDIVFSRIVELEGQAIMVGMAPAGLPPRLHRVILDTRDDLKKRLQRHGGKLDQRLLLEFDLEMRNLYFDLVELAFNPPLPELRNTDGEPLKFVKLRFKLHCPPEEAIAALKSLSLPEFQGEILARAARDSAGNLTEVTFSWQKRGNKTQKHWDNTTLGTLTIKGDVLTAEVNSERRAEKIKSEIAKRLKKSATLEKADYESVESKLEEMENQAATPAAQEEHRKWEELQSRPEVQALIRKQMDAHWERWYNERIPALKNKTPLEAARTKAGRERLEALLLEYERNDERATDPNLRVDVAAMRKKLGL